MAILNSDKYAVIFVWKSSANKVKGFDQKLDHDEMQEIYDLIKEFIPDESFSFLKIEPINLIGDS